MIDRTARLLIVDDDAQITRVLETVLTNHGYRIRTASDGQAALAEFDNWGPHLVVTDLCMPHVDGLALCRRIRAVARTPIIVLSVKHAEAAKVDALDSGADDYITKPFGIGELLARIRAALRRSSDDGEQPARIAAGDFQIDLAARRVEVGGREVRLTPKEFDLFVFLARHPNRVIAHRTLLEAVWGHAFQDHPEYLRVYMAQLRKKLEPEPSAPRYLATEPWIGYRLNPAGRSTRAPASAVETAVHAE